MISTILALATITFSTRYLFLEKHLPLRLGPHAKRALSFSGPAVLAAITGPILFTNDQQLNLSINSPYLWGGIAAILAARLNGNIYLTMFTGGTVFTCCKMLMPI